MTAPVIPRFPSDRPVLDGKYINKAWEYYFRTIERNLPEPGTAPVTSFYPITIQSDGRHTIDFKIDGTTVIDGNLHFPHLTGDVSNDGTNVTLNSIVQPVATSTILKVTHDDKGRIISSEPVTASDLTDIINGVIYPSFTGVFTMPITAPAVTLDNAYVSTGTVTPGTFTWNATDQTANLQLSSNVSLQLGQESNILITNRTGSDFVDLQAVYITGAQGNRLTAALALANSDATSAATIGIVTEPIANNQLGFVTTTGLVRQVNTSAWAEGDQLYLSSTIPGGITNVKPVAPQHLVVIGWVVRSHSVNGSIYVNVNNGYELEELHNVLISTPTNGQVLTYEASTQLWKNKTPTGGGGGTGSGDIDGGVSSSIYTTAQLVDGGASI
jgi:hypothetical protein